MLSKILDTKKHRLLYLWDMLDAHSMHKTVDQRKIRHGARHWKIEAQRKCRQSKDCARYVMKNNYDSILLRFQQSETYKESQQAIGWDEDTCRRLGKIASEDHSYIATWEERRRYENNWKLSLNTQGRASIMKARSDYSDVVITIRDLRQKDDQKADRPLPPSQQIRHVQHGETSGGGIRDHHRLRLRQTVNGHPHGDLHQNEKTSVFFICARVSLTGNSDSLVSDGVCKRYTAPRTCHTRIHFSRVAQYIATW